MGAPWHFRVPGAPTLTSVPPVVPMHPLNCRWQLLPVWVRGVRTLRWPLTRPSSSQHHWADDMQDRHTHSWPLSVSRGGPQECTGGEGMLLEPPLSNGSLSLGDKTHTWSHSTHRASFPTPDYSFLPLFFPERTKIKAFLFSKRTHVIKWNDNVGRGFILQINHGLGF